LVAVELVGCVAGVHDANGDDWRVSVIVGPVRNSGGQRDEVTFSEVVDPLVLVPHPLLALLAGPSPLLRLRLRLPE